MDNFPKFMKHPENKTACLQQAVPGVQEYVFDGAAGSQMAFWTCADTASSATHIRDFDEFMLI